MVALIVLALLAVLVAITGVAILILRESPVPSSAIAHRRRWLPWAMFGSGLAFWPLYGLLTVFEDRTGLQWFLARNKTFWLCAAAVSLFITTAAPLGTNWRIEKKLAAAIGSALAFALMFFVVLAVGARYFGWLDD